MSTPDAAASTAVAPDPDYSRRQAWYLVFALLACNVIAQVDRFALTLLVSPMQKDLGLSDTEIGLIGGLVTGVFYAIAGLPLARVADQYNRKWLVIVCLIGWSAMTAGQGLAVGFWSLCLVRLFLTMGEAALGPSASSLISNVFHTSQLARPNSVFAVGGSLGNAVASGLVALFLFMAPFVAPPLTFSGEPMAPWRVVMIGLGLAGIVPMLMLMFAQEPKRPPAGDTGASFKAFLRHLRPRLGAYVPCYFGYAFFVLPFVALNFWLPTLFERVHGMSTTVSGAWLGLGYLVASVPGTLAGGWLADYWERNGREDGKLRVLLTATVLATVGVVGAMQASDPRVAMAFVWLGMGCAGMGLGPVLAAIQTLTPAQFRAQATALLYLLIFIVAFMGIPVAGAITDRVFQDPLRITDSLLILGLVFGALAVLIVMRGKGRYVQERRLQGHQAAGSAA